MARVVALVPDLLLGSQVQGMLAAAGHDVQLISGPDALGDQLASADALVVDLTDQATVRIEAVGALIVAWARGQRSSSVSRRTR